MQVFIFQRTQTSDPVWSLAIESVFSQRGLKTDSNHLDQLGNVMLMWSVAHKILATAQRPNSTLPFWDLEP